MNNFKNEYLFNALAQFIEAMRPYIVAKLMAEFKDDWHIRYYDALSRGQQEVWEQGVQNGTPLQNLIDFNNLKSFALNFKHLLRDDFGRKTNSLPTWFEDIAEARNKCQHFTRIDLAEADRAFSTMILIMKQLGMHEVQAVIEALRDQKPTSTAAQKTGGPPEISGLLPWFMNVTPHLDIRQGHLDESVFAANLNEVALGNGREIYLNPTVFFNKTYFTLGLKTVARRVVRGLNGDETAENRVVSLQTGFGGGKTHTLISLFHLAKWGKKIADSDFARKLVEFTSAPEFETANVAVFTNRTNDPAQGRKVNGTQIQTLWGELAFQLGGEAAYEIIRANDEQRTAPKGLFNQVLEQCQPVLILIDELADYCVAAAGIPVGASTLADQTISFVQELSESVAQTNRCVLVATLPASVVEVTNSEKASQILSSLSNRMARVSADTRPVADEEIFEVVRRRLFEDLGDSEQIEKIISEYLALYQNLFTEIPNSATRSEYKEKMRKSYPFHPELIDMFRIRWASNHDFQRTRGVLRLLASIVADLWQRQGSLTGVNALIHTSDVNFANLDALSEQLKKLYGNGYDAVISADVAGTSSNSFQIDQTKKEYGQFSLTQGIGATILLGSFGSTGPNKGIGLDEIKLCLLKPNLFNHNHINGALDALESSAHYLYYSSTASMTKRYWFHTKPNINILINQARNDVSTEEINGEILRRINRSVSNINLFNVLVNPGLDIPEQKRPTLIILGPQYQANPAEINSKTRPVIEAIATKKGNSERIFRNTILFLVCSDVGVTKLRNDLRDYLACIKIRDEYQSQLETDQKNDIRRKIEEYSTQSDRSLVTAYSILVKYSAKGGLQKLLVRQFKNAFDIQINSTIIQLLKDEFWLLESVGMNLLQKNNLLPTAARPVQVKAIYEAFIQFDDKPMITGIEAIQTSLLRYCTQGQFAIASGDGTEFTQIYYKEMIPAFDAGDPIFWLVDKSLYQPAKTQAPEPTELSGIGDEKAQLDQPSQVQPPTSPEVKRFKSITISGKIDVANYSQVFTSFIVPLQANRVEIEIKIKGVSTTSSPLSETSQQYKITKESAAQLGLNFEVEE